MPSSETEICNLALGHLGEAPIASLDDDTAASRACALQYALCRDQALRGHRWNFAVTRVVLSELDDEPLFGYGHQYEIPANCLRILEVNDSEMGDVISEPFTIEGRKLLTNAATVNVIYIRRITDVSQFDALFVEALALKLAIKLTEVIRGTTGKTAELLQAHQQIIAPMARRVDSNEGRRRRGLLSLNSHFIRARGGWDGDSLGGRAWNLVLPAANDQEFTDAFGVPIEI